MELLFSPTHAGQQRVGINSQALGEIEGQRGRSLIQLLVVEGVIIGRTRNSAGQYPRNPGVAASQVVQWLAAVGVFDAVSGTKDSSFLIGPGTDDIAHVAILAHANVVVGIRSGEQARRERPDP